MDRNYICTYAKLTQKESSTIYCTDYVTFIKKNTAFIICKVLNSTGEVVVADMITVYSDTVLPSKVRECNTVKTVTSNQLFNLLSNSK